jgi:N,N'-diacetyllegionaminate synthase
MKKVRIGERWTGEGEPCFVIAEAGVNHNGDMALAKRLIDVAREAGADAVKFQTFSAEQLVTENADKAAYQKEQTDAQESQFAMLKRLELGTNDFKELAGYAQKRGVIFLSSPFDMGSVDLLAEIGVPAFKVPSGEITNPPLLRHIARKKKPVILSTGMSTLDEVAEAVRLFQKEGTKDIILLHCVSCYPARVEDTNLRAMDTLRKAFKLPVGLSDHTQGITVAIAAVALGACVIEKHFTLDRDLPGPDHKASLEPDELKEMIEAIRDTEKALGDGIKQPVKAEADTKKVARRSLVAKVNIGKGTVLSEDMIDIKRCRTGNNLEPKHLSLIAGKRVNTDIAAGEPLTADMLE